MGVGNSKRVADLRRQGDEEEERERRKLGREDSTWWCEV